MNTPKLKARPESGAGSVHTSAQPDTAGQAAAPVAGCVGCGGCGGCAKKPDHHKASAPVERDAYTGLAGRYVRDPSTGERKPAVTQG